MAFWSYSQLALYKKCPRKFLWLRVEKRPTPGFDGRKAFIGTLLQKIVERFYVEERWRDAANASAWMLNEIPVVSQQVTIAEGLSWDVGEEAKWRLIAAETIPKIISVIRSERLLGVRNFSEAEIEVPFGMVASGAVTDRVVGRVDFIFEGVDGSLTVLDGKAGGSFGKFVDPDQLRLYALGVLVSPTFRRLPTRLGFWWYRHSKIVWRPVSAKTLQVFAEGVRQTIARVRAKDYAPTPGGGCRYCEFKADCPEGRAWLWRAPTKVVVDESESNTGTVGF